MSEQATDIATLTEAEREALAEVLGSITLTSGMWSAPPHMDKVTAAVERIVGDRLAAVAAFAAENEMWESRVPRGPGNASYVNGFENGWRAFAEQVGQHPSLIGLTEGADCG